MNTSNSSCKSRKNSSPNTPGNVSKGVEVLCNPSGLVDATSLSRKSNNEKSSELMSARSAFGMSMGMKNGSSEVLCNPSDANGSVDLP